MSSGQQRISHTPHRSYRPEIDGLRAMAVIAVIINHFGGNRLSSGYLGVDIFFVISGYVITASLMRHPSTNLKDLLSGFYARRVKRILPALLLSTAILSTLICIVNPTPTDSLITGLSAIFGASNIYLREQAINYFAASTQLNAFTHTWSLGVEEQFYLIYPIILWYCLKKNRSHKPLLITICAAILFLLFLLISRLTTDHLFGLFPGQMEGFLLASGNLWPLLLIPLAASIRIQQSGIRNAVVLLALFSGASLASFLHLYPTHQASAYFLMPSRFWELGAGSLLLLCSGFQSERMATTKKFLAMPALIGMVAVLFLPVDQAILATISTVLLTCLFIYSAEPGNPAYALLSQKQVVGIGLISYSLYLWHWGVLAISRWTIGVHAWTVPLQISLMFAAAWASFHWVEKPLRKANWAPSRTQTIGIGMGLILVTASFLASLSRWGEALALDRRFPSSWSSQFFQGAEEFQQRSLLHNTVDQKRLEATLTRDDRGLELLRPRLYILGDSHSNHYVEALKKALPQWGVGSASVGWQCGYISPLDINNQTKKWMADCESYQRFADTFLIDNLEPGDVVMAGHRWKEKKFNSHTETTLNHLAELVQRKGARLLLIDDVPEISEDNPLLCNKRPWRPSPAEGCFRSQAAVDADQRPYDAMVERIQNHHPNVIYTRLRDLYCVNQMCGPYKGDMMIYRDTDHLTAAASQLGARTIAEAIEHSRPGHASHSMAPHSINPSQASEEAPNHR